MILQLWEVKMLIHLWTKAAHWIPHKYTSIFVFYFQHAPAPRPPVTLPPIHLLTSATTTKTATTKHSRHTTKPSVVITDTPEPKVNVATQRPGKTTNKDKLTMPVAMTTVSTTKQISKFQTVYSWFGKVILLKIFLEFYSFKGAVRDCWSHHLRVISKSVKIGFKMLFLKARMLKYRDMWVCTHSYYGLLTRKLHTCIFARLR